MKGKLKKVLTMLFVTIVTFVIFDLAVKSTLTMGLVTSVILTNPSVFTISISYLKYIGTLMWFKFIHLSLKDKKH